MTGIIDRILHLVGLRDGTFSQQEGQHDQPYIMMLPAVPGSLSQPVTVLRQSFEPAKRGVRGVINSC